MIHELRTAIWQEQEMCRGACAKSVIDSLRYPLSKRMFLEIAEHFARRVALLDDILDGLK